ncbi:MAG: ABC transporter ATP-binding protein [Victivallales bacterium]|nr:ABC transporter ATP-binding protein [Victivallales bacterium]
MEIRVTNLVKHYGKVHAVDGLDFTLASGKVTALVGPNGAGKSTLLRLLSGREEPDSGDVTYDGVSVVEYPERLAAQIGFMPDSLPTATNWKVLPYLDFYARANGLKEPERSARVKEIMEFTRLSELADRRLAVLSKGLKQRVSLARVLIPNSAILLLDEPAAGLDPRARIELRDDIRQLAAKGQTILISSHILTELEDMCDEVLIMERGKILRSGAVAELELAAHTAAGEAIRKITLEFATLSPELLTKVRELPHVTEVVANSRRALSVTVHGGDAEVDEALAAAFQNHLGVTGFRRGTDLEAVFMASTTGAVQ